MPDFHGFPDNRLNASSIKTRIETRGSGFIFAKSMGLNASSIKTRIETGIEQDIEYWKIAS